MFDLHANFVYPLPYEQVDSFTDTVFVNGFSIQDQDTTFLRFQNIHRYSTRINYEPDPGVEIFGSFTIPLTSRFSLVTGLGLSYYSFRAEDENDVDFVATLSVDTLESNEQIIFPGVLLDCDCYENSIDDIIHADFRPYYKHLNLMIPAGVDFAVIPGRLTAGVGVFSQIPLYAGVNRNLVSIDRYEMDGMTKCRYNLVETQDNSGDGIRHFQAGISAGVKIGFLPSLHLGIGARKLLTNVFVNPEYQSSSFFADDFRPISITVGVTYSFHKSFSIEN